MILSDRQQIEWRQKLQQIAHMQVSLSKNGTFFIHNLSATEYSTVLNRLRGIKEIVELSYNKDGYDFNKYRFDHGYAEPQSRYCVRGRIELPEESLNEDIEVHDELNPNIWTAENDLQEELHEKILDIIDDYLETLKEAEIDFKLKDIILVGSNCSYNYTNDSDLDIHVIFDISDLAKTDSERLLLSAIYSAYATLWNKGHEVTLNSIPVELYAQIDDELEDVTDEKESEITEKIASLLHNKKLTETLINELKERTKLQSNGIYSVLQNKWLKRPDKNITTSYNEEEFKNLFDEWEDRYLKLMSTKNITADDIDKFIDDLYQLRINAMKNEGEFGIGNLVFKEFRNKKYLQKMRDLRGILVNKALSFDK